LHGDHPDGQMAKRILVVDDQAYLRDVQVMLLQEAGYAATASASGAEALARLGQERPDLILLDMSMPGMDGRQFLHRLRAEQQWATLPVILSTGHLAETLGSLRHQTVDVLAKPFSDRALLETVRRLIGDA
jgi:CheY-like chemotaxis protein